jgi:hypothetical protein
LNWGEKDEMSSEEFAPKFKKPKILLIDLPEEVLKGIQSLGFNASAGTFGSPYRVAKSDDYCPLISKHNLPNYSEQDIIFIDLNPPKTLNKPVGEKLTSDGEPDWWAKCSQGKIDPRPRIMLFVQKSSDRIIQHGGLFVIFAQPRLHQDLIFGKKEFPYRVDKIRDIEYDNWAFLSISSLLNIEYDSGEEINVIDYESDHQLIHFLKKYLYDFRYDATFYPYSEKTKWIPILRNKFGKDVGGLILSSDSKGIVLILPQNSKKTDIIIGLLQEVLPDLSCHLFPEAEGARWLERPEYELDSVLKYKSDEDAIKQRAKKELDELEMKINEERDKLGFLHGIITKTGDDLVADVKSALQSLGFDKIKDIDEELRENGLTGQKQEDLQIHDSSPTLLVEVKGVSGHPSESDTTQVVKYVNRRMREWDSTRVHGVSIINHQRNLPGLERDNVNVFSGAQVKDAENQDVTLVSTWDLFLL